MVTPGRGPLEFDVDANTEEAERKLRDLEELADRATQDQSAFVDVETGEAERALERTEEAAEETESALSRLNGQIQEIPLIGDAFRALTSPVGAFAGLIGGLLVSLNQTVERYRELTVLAGAGGLTGPEAVAVQRAAERVGAEPQPILTSLTQFGLRREELLAGTISDEERAVLSGLGITPGLAQQLDQFQFAQLIFEQAGQLPPRQVGTALERLGADEEIAGFIRPDIVGPERTLQRLLAEELAAAPTQAEFAQAQAGAQQAQDARSLIGRGFQSFGDELVFTITDPGRILRGLPLFGGGFRGGPGFIEEEVLRSRDLGVPLAPLPDISGRPFLNLGVPDDDAATQPIIVNTFIGSERVDTTIANANQRNQQRGRNDGTPDWAGR